MQRFDASRHAALFCAAGTRHAPTALHLSGHLTSAPLTAACLLPPAAARAHPPSQPQSLPLCVVRCTEFLRLQLDGCGACRPWAECSCADACSMHCRTALTAHAGVNLDGWLVWHSMPTLSHPNTSTTCWQVYRMHAKQHSTAHPWRSPPHHLQSSRRQRPVYGAEGAIEIRRVPHAPARQ